MMKAKTAIELIKLDKQAYEQFLTVKVLFYRNRN